MTNLPEPLRVLGQQTLTKVADKFVDFVITKYTGKSIKVFEAEGDIEADKVMTKWEVLDKPFWIQAEAAKMGRQYQNFGTTIQKAIPDIDSENSNIEDDNDFFWGLLEHSKEISDSNMQDLIAGIIAGEYNNPGSYSVSALQAIKNLGRHELELFQKMGSLLVGDRLMLPYDLFSGQDNVKELMTEMNLDFESIQTLQSLGLFLPNSMLNPVANPESKNFVLSYQNKKLLYKPIVQNAEDVDLPSYFGLSIAGKQILKHLEVEFQDKYYQWLRINYKIGNYNFIEEESARDTTESKIQE